MPYLAASSQLTLPSSQLFCASVASSATHVFRYSRHAIPPIRDRRCSAPVCILLLRKSHFVIEGNFACIFVPYEGNAERRALGHSVPTSHPTIVPRTLPARIESPTLFRRLRPHMAFC
ncbi:hypothetical protein DL95DRAFT_387364 [Leptodontidium sp. 2 PMI_412]|nr:hypothetical protein DL95DRAFT_387364 [Leptodontidium sp. 2 PMI_412]